MFGIKTSNGYTDLIDGIKIKTVVYGELSLMTEFVLAKDALLPEHSHVHEQTGYLLKGKIKLFIDGNSRVLCAGDSWCVPANFKHKAEILEDSLALEIFTPCREEYKVYAHSNDIDVKGQPDSK